MRRYQCAYQGSRVAERTLVIYIVAPNKTPFPCFQSSTDRSEEKLWTFHGSCEPGFTPSFYVLVTWQAYLWAKRESRHTLTLLCDVYAHLGYCWENGLLSLLAIFLTYPALVLTSGLLLMYFRPWGKSPEKSSPFCSSLWISPASQFCLVSAFLLLMASLYCEAHWDGSFLIHTSLLHEVGSLLFLSCHCQTTHPLVLNPIHTTHCPPWWESPTDPCHPWLFVEFSSLCLDILSLAQFFVILVSSWKTCPCALVSKFHHFSSNECLPSASRVQLRHHSFDLFLTNT